MLSLRLRSQLAGIAIVLVAEGAAIAMPTGVFLLYPGNTAPSGADCRSLSARVRPSVEKAEAWYWGRAPFGSEMEFYLFLSKTRMETTFSAEGDYDTGELRNPQTRGDKTTFELVPDDHPAQVVSGWIEQSRDGSVLSVTLHDVPTIAAEMDRTTYYCSFDAGTQI